MESGDIIDAHLEQVRTRITLPGCSFLSILIVRFSNSSEDGIGADVTPRAPLNFLLGYLYDIFRQ